MTHVIEKTLISDWISFNNSFFNSLLLSCPISDTRIPNLGTLFSMILPIPTLNLESRIPDLRLIPLS